MKFLHSGKVKDVYELGDGNLLFRFSDRVSAYDVKFRDNISRKGEVLCKFAEFWFNQLSVPNHLVGLEGKDKMIVKKMRMIPIECIVRGYFYGSLIQRWQQGKTSLAENVDTRMAAKLPEPIFDPTTKSTTHDLPISKEQVLNQNLVTEEEYEWLEKTTIEIYKEMYSITNSAGYILADLKLEFGKHNGDMLLGDSIGPDEYRLWPKDSYEVGRVQEAYDKQLLRDWLTENGYQKQFEEDRKAGKELIAPSIPIELREKMSMRYIESYQRITGNTF